MTNAEAVPIIFGEVLFDRFPDGSTVLGGAPFNVAWHLQALGRSPVFISRVGNDPLGQHIRTAMETWGMTTSGLQLDSAHPTGTVEVSFRDGEPAFDIVADRAYDFIDGDCLPPLPAASLIYHGSLALRNPQSQQALERLFDSCDAPGFVDVNLRPPWWSESLLQSILDKARWAKLNENELQILAPGNASIAKGAATLLRRHDMEMLLVTQGEKGAAAYGRDGLMAEIKPDSKSEVVDSVGAGDAFSSILILGLLLDWPLQETLSRAQSFASAIVGVRGATVSDPAFYAPFIEHWKLDQQ